MLRVSFVALATLLEMHFVALVVTPHMSVWTHASSLEPIHPAATAPAGSRVVLCPNLLGSSYVWICMT